MDGKRVVFSTDAKFNLIPSGDGSPGTLEGYAMVWNVKSTDRGGYKVMLAPNSAKFMPSTFALVNHNFDSPVARTDNGSLNIISDNFGAKVSIKLANNTAGRDAAENVKTKLVTGMSFAMLLDDDAKFTTSKDSDGDEIDTFSAFNCDEVTITPVPAFPQTTINTAGPSPFAQEMARRNFSRISKELDHDLAKFDLYQFKQYPAELAEISDPESHQ